MSQKKQRVLGRIFGLSLVWIGILWFIVSLFFWIIGASSGGGGTEPSLLFVAKNFINRLLGLLSLLSLLIGTPLGIVRLVRSYKEQDYNAKISIKNNEIENIYNSDFDVSKLLQDDIKSIKNHGFKKEFSSGLAIFLNIITLGLFGFFYYGFKHDNLPKIKDNDFGSGKAIGFMFIPFFNIYWHFVLRLKLTNRINLQYKVRNQTTPISKGLVITTLILNFIPYINFISMFILQSIVIYQIQTSINKLTKE